MALVAPASPDPHSPSVPLDRLARPARRVFWAVLLGSLLVELAWILALPAFRGADEFDHAYKSDAVAHGQLRGTEQARAGRGELLDVSAALVAAAGPMCARYDYTGPDNCRPVRSLGDGRVEVASAAASYDPVYYAIAGTLARPFRGVAALFALRAATALLSSLLLAAAASLVARWARPGWPWVALGVCATPVLLQSAGVAAPNAVGYSAACLLWAAALTVLGRSGPAPWTALVVGAVGVLVTHTTGVLWLGLVLVAVAGLRSRAWWRGTWRSQRRPMSIALLVTGLTGVACVAWIRLAHTNALGAPAPGLPPLRLPQLLSAETAWGLQTIAAFPLRNEAAPPLVYAAWLVLLVTVLALGHRVAPARVRVVLLGLLLAWLAVPTALTLVSYRSEGLAWQGRYALPLAIGLPMVAGWVLSEREMRLPRAGAVGVVALIAVGHVVSVVSVTLREAHGHFGGTFAHVVAHAAVVTGGLALCGVVLAAVGVTGRVRSPRDTLTP